MIYLQLCFSFSPGALKMDEVLAGYELCSVAPSLFDDNGFMRSGGKSKLADYLVPAAAKTQGSINDILKNKQNKIVLDGGALVQRVTWPRGSTFQQVLENYELHIRKMCGSLVNRVQVVFDGYTENSTKDHIHLKRNPVQSMEMHFKVDRSNFTMQEIYILVEPSEQTQIYWHIEKPPAEPRNRGLPKSKRCRLNDCSKSCTTYRPR